MIFGRRFEKGSKVKYYLDELSYRLSQSQVNNLALISIWPWLRYVLLAFSSKARRFQKGGDELIGFMKQEIQDARKRYDPRTSDESPECLVHAFDKSAFNGEGEDFTDAQLLVMITDLFLAGKSRIYPMISL